MWSAKPLHPNLSHPVFDFFPEGDIISHGELSRAILRLGSKGYRQDYLQQIHTKKIIMHKTTQATDPLVQHCNVEW